TGHKTRKDAKSGILSCFPSSRRERGVGSGASASVGASVNNNNRSARLVDGTLGVAGVHRSFCITSVGVDRCFGLAAGVASVAVDRCFGIATVGGNGCVGVNRRLRATVRIGRGFGGHRAVSRRAGGVYRGGASVCTGVVLRSGNAAVVVVTTADQGQCAAECHQSE